MDDRLARYAPFSGIAFAILVLAAFAVMSDMPDFLDPGDEIATWFADDSDTVLLGGTLTSLGAVALLWFVGSITSALRAADAGPRLASIAHSGGVAAGALYLASSSVLMAAALRADEDGAIDPTIASGMHDLSLILFGAAAPFAVAGSAAFFSASAAFW